MQYLLFIAIAPTVAVVCLAIAGYALRHRQVPAASTLALYMLTVSVFLITNTLELLWPTERGTLFWAQSGYLFIASFPLIWLAFAFQYAGRESWLSPRYFRTLAVIPATTFILAITNSFHGLIWQTYTFHPVGNMLALRVSHGPWFWIHTFYAYLLLLGGGALVLHAYLVTPRLYRRELLWGVVGVFVFAIGNLIYIFRLIPGLQKDYTPLALALAGLIFSAGIFRYHMPGLVPAARVALVEQMQEGVIVADRQRRVIDINPAARRILRLYGEPAGMFLRLALPWCPEALLTAEVRMTRCTMPERTVLEVQTSPLQNRRGQVTGWLVIVRDVTAQVRAEEVLQQSNRELQAWNEELDTFGHTVAHDLKNPLGIILGFAELLDGSSPNLTEADRQMAVRNIIRTAQRMDRIVEELMVLAGLRQMDKPPAQRLDMVAIVEVVLDRLGPAIRAAGAEIVLPSGWPTALGYTPWVEEVWMNYLSNAIKYGGSPPHIELGSTIQEGMVRFWIHDNGPGLTPQEQERLFQPFERLGAARATGHGLGLSIVRRLVERMGGTVGVESTGIPGEGCTFSFTLPLAA